MAIRRVIGVELDGSTVTTTYGRREVPALKATYADMLETEVVRQMGSQRQDARTPGIYKTDTCTISYRASVFRASLMPLFPTNGAGNVVLPIVVGFTHPDIGSDSDLLNGARCVNWSQAVEASAKGLEVETKWELIQIFWTSQRKTINQISGPLGSAIASLGLTLF